MDKLDLSKNNLRKFGITMGIVFLLITLIILIRHKESALAIPIISAVFFIAAFNFPFLLKPIYIFWMKLAFVLSWINTRLILFIIFYLIFTPLGLALKLFGKDLLDRKIEKNKESYWKRKESVDFNPINYQRQF